MIDRVQLNVLRVVQQRLKPTSINWVVTGSLSFAIRGMDVAVHDIDIQTDRDGAHEIERLFKEYSKQPVRFSSSERIQSYFGALEIAGIQVEIMGDIQKRNADTSWETPVDLSLHKEWVKVEEMTIPVLSLSHEYQAYLKLGRAERAEQLKRFMEKMGKGTRGS